MAYAVVTAGKFDSWKEKLNEISDNEGSSIEIYAQLYASSIEATKRLGLMFMDMENYDIFSKGNKIIKEYYS